MRLKFYTLFILLFTAFGFTIYKYCCNELPVTKNNPLNAQSATPSKMIDAKFTNYIEAHEYQIKNKNGIYTSPNRAQNLRAVYHADGFEITPRQEAAVNWNFKLKLAAINKGGESLKASEKPVFRLEDELLSVVHQNYTIEYVNNKQGTRQNFIIAKKPQGNAALKVLLKPEGSLALQTVDKKAATFGDHTGAKLNYQDLKVWDANGKILPAKMEIEGKLLALVVDDQNAVYPVTVDPLAANPSQILQGVQSSSEMGYSVASAGDLNKDGFGDLAVGAILYDNGEADEGAVFVYYGSVNGVPATPSLILEGNAEQLRFGYSIASADIDGNGYSDLVIGAPQYHIGPGLYTVGAIYVYTWSGSGPTSSPLILKGDKAGARLGTCVALGDLNGDGLPDIASGALGYNDLGALWNGQGGVYVFYNTGQAVRFEDSFANATGERWDILTSGLQGGVEFGGSTTGVSIGNFNGDAYGDLVVGVAGYDEGVTNQGAVYLYLGSATGVPSTFSKRFTSGQANAYLGASVAFAGDLNKDGFGDIAVGAPYYADSESREGAVFVYYGNAADPITVQTITSNITDAYMGYTVAGGGDLNGDGTDDLAVGAYNYKFPPDVRGGLFVFAGSPTGLSTTPILTKQDNTANLNGFSIAFAKKLKGTNVIDLVVGIPGYTGGVSSASSVALYSGEPTTLPVSLKQFDAKLQANGSVVLTWSTFSESNSEYFEVWHRDEAGMSKSLGRRQAKGNSNVLSNYALSDQAPAKGKNYYTLMQRDLNGNTVSLGTEVVTADLQDLQFSLYPNPTVGMVKLSFSPKTYQKAALLSLSGKVIVEKEIAESANELEFNLAALPSSVYLVRVKEWSGKTVTKRLVKK